MCKCTTCLTPATLLKKKLWHRLEHLFDRTPPFDCLYPVSQHASINSFQPSVKFHIETSHLICSANQITGFYMKCNTGLELVKAQRYIILSWALKAVCEFLSAITIIFMLIVTLVYGTNYSARYFLLLSLGCTIYCAAN